MTLKREIFNYLKTYSTDPQKINRIIVSNYLDSWSFKPIKNKIINQLIIKKKDTDNFSKQLFREIQPLTSFEQIIEAFEFVISPSDKIINGAIYTPENIRNYIVNKSLYITNNDLNQIRTGDIACGCGGFLLTLAQAIKAETGKSYFDIFRDNLFGVDIAPYSIERTKILLTLLAVVNGEDREEFEFNLFVANSLNFDWQENSQIINVNQGFDIIVGNPPYVASRNMEKESMELMGNWEVARTGHPDLYIPFFQVGLENLNQNGILGYITVNTFIKSINGRALRQYFADNDINLTILNFGGEQVFKDRNTYTCICFLRHGNGQVNYLRTESDNITNIDFQTLHRFDYDDLDHRSGWNLVNQPAQLDFINLVEGVGTPFRELYNTKNGIATLKNDIYKFKPLEETKTHYILKDETGPHLIEKKICRDIVNANKVKTIVDIDRLREKVIFPYDEQINIHPEKVMQKKFPKALAYLSTKRAILATRDKSAGNYEAWYAFGRRQSMDIKAYKLFFPHICERPTFVICEEQDLLFYNGIAIVSEDLQELQVIKKIMESDLFFKYIRYTTKDYASGYISMSRNYLKNFGVYQFADEDEKARFLAMEKQEAERFLEGVYGVARQRI